MPIILHYARPPPWGQESSQRPQLGQANQSENQRSKFYE